MYVVSFQVIQYVFKKKKISIKKKGLRAGWSLEWDKDFFFSSSRIDNAEMIDRSS